MRHFSSLLALSAIALGSNASSASIFTFDSYNQWRHLRDPTVADDTARLVLEHRIKSPDSSFLGRAEAETVELLNLAGGEPSPLFGVSSRYNDNLKQGIFILEGIGREVVSSLQRDYSENVMLSYPSANFLDDDFLSSLLRIDFKSESQAVRGPCYFHSHNSGVVPETLQAAQKCLDKYPGFRDFSQLHGKELLRHVDVLESWIDDSKSMAVLKVSIESLGGSAGTPLVTDTLGTLFRRLSVLASEGKQITTVLLGAENSPHAKQALRSRDTTKEHTLAKPVLSAVNGQQSRISPATGQERTIPSTLPPVCHASESVCNETTRHCSGHGFCYKKSGSESEGAAGDCYACKCQETTFKKGDGTVQRIRWGGSACQKRDISTPFFLIASISITIVVAVGIAIGMLFSVGQDELPGVISAGVGAPRGQK